MKKSLTIKLYGLVQGVFFRDAVAKKAFELGVTGFVENQPDGTVVVVAEGDEVSLKELLNWSKCGPEFAQVEKVENQWTNATSAYENFQVK